TTVFGGARGVREASRESSFFSGGCTPPLNVARPILLKTPQFWFFDKSITNIYIQAVSCQVKYIYSYIKITLDGNYPGATEGSRTPFKLEAVSLKCIQKK
ncbi:MAG: hypothetical protein KAR83_00910, partial [Thermodesulfovibrionales bacterium]|nr:hypothetical protein [Thermodesulfovibrionales bacterium]